MRTLLFTLVLSACAGPETDLDRFNDLKARATTDCGSLFSDGVRCNASETSAQAAIQCMNDSLANGVRATFDFGSTDAHLFGIDTVYFTVGPQVQVYNYYAGPSDSGDGPTAIPRPSCSGPFELYMGRCAAGAGMDYGLTLDGC